MERYEPQRVWKGPKHKRKSRPSAIVATLGALALVAGAVLLFVGNGSANAPTPLAAAPADIVLSPGLAGSDLNQWCRDRVAAGTTGLTSRAKNWLTDCIAVSNPLPTPSPSPTGTPSPTPTTPSPTPTSPSPTPTTPPPTTTVPPTTTPPVTTPPPSPTPTPTGVLTGCLADPGRCGYPDATTAGAHGTLAAYTGPTTISVAGTVIENVAINGCIQLMAPNVVFRNVTIACTNPSPYVVDTPHAKNAQGVDTGPAYSDGVNSFDHVTIRCGGNGGTAIGEARIVAVAVDIGGGCENGFDIDTGLTLTDSYIHNLTQSDAFDADGVQAWPDARNLVYRHNTVLVCCFDNSTFTTGGQAGQTLVIENNLLAGGNNEIYCAGDTGSLTGNRFGPLHSTTGNAPFGYTSGCGNMTRSGNVLDTTGQPLDPV